MLSRNHRLAKLGLCYDDQEALLDYITTKLCSGTINANDLAIQLSKNPRMVFGGAAFRSLQCFVAASTVSYGNDLGKIMHQSIADYFKKDQILSNNVFNDIDLQEEEAEFCRTKDKLKEIPKSSVKETKAEKLESKKTNVKEL